jgi:hypothetical protein
LPDVQSDGGGGLKSHEIFVAVEENEIATG